MPLPEYPPWRAPAPASDAVVRAAAKTLTCDTCGALIGDRRIHTRWHDTTDRSHVTCQGNHP